MSEGRRIQASDQNLCAVSEKSNVTSTLQNVHLTYISSLITLSLTKATNRHLKSDKFLHFPQNEIDPSVSQVSWLKDGA